MKRRVSQVSVLVSGPQLLFAQSVAAVLRAQYGMNVLDVHPGSAAGVAAAASEFLPDVVVSEAWMSDLQGADAVAAIKRAVPESRIILLSGAHRPDQIRRAIAAGAD
ncbi:MAG: response regulator, partial [Actinomycetota bacterium]